MTDEKREYWSNLIAEQEASGQTIRAFCQKQSVGDHSFHYWRKRLQKSEPVQFALLKTVASAAPLELILANGEQLRIRNGVDAATFRLVLDVVRRLIHPPASVRVYLCLSPCDMRRSSDGLHALVRDHLQLDPFAGHLYLFATSAGLPSGRNAWKRVPTRFPAESRTQGVLRSAWKTRGAAERHRSEQRYAAQAVSAHKRIKHFDL